MSETTTNKYSRVSSRVDSIPSSGIRKFFDLIASSDDIISLGVGEPDFITPWNIREAAIYSIERGHTHYTSNNGSLDLRRELSKHLKNRMGKSYDPNTEILVTVGVSEGLDLAVRTLTEVGDEIMVPEPSFVAYGPIVHMAGGEFIGINTSMENKFIPSVKDLESNLTDKTRVLLINNPNNPTGTVISKEVLSQIAEFVIDNDLVVIADEIYDRLIYGNKDSFVHFASLPGMFERTVTLNGFSKSYAMTGWRIGYATGPEEILAGMTKLHQYTMMSAPTVAQYAAKEALTNGENSLTEMLDAYAMRRRLLLSGLNNIGLDCVEPDGAFYAFPSIKSTGLSSESFAEKLLLEERVAVVPGNVFGPSGEGFIRCCYAASVEDIKEAIFRIGRFVEKQTNNN
ncbi:MAG: aminotransferase class I/II-fold pyridoxal phosphate-dependent enzyme [Dehalococcoidia bacterium]